MAQLTGGNPVAATKLEYTQRKVIDNSTADWVWDANSPNTWFKIVVADDCLLKVQLTGETEAEGKANGFFIFQAGEGSNARVIKVFTDGSDTIGGTMWAVR